MCCFDAYRACGPKHRIPNDPRNRRIRQRRPTGNSHPSRHAVDWSVAEVPSRFIIERRREMSGSLNTARTYAFALRDFLESCSLAGLAWNEIAYERILAFRTGGWTVGSPRSRLTIGSRSFAPTTSGLPSRAIATGRLFRQRPVPYPTGCVCVKWMFLRGQSRSTRSMQSCAAWRRRMRLWPNLRWSPGCGPMRFPGFPIHRRPVPSGSLSGTLPT